MKNQQGNALVVALVSIVLLGGATYALVSRDVLKSYFETGKIPTQDDKKIAPLNAEGNLTDSGADGATTAQFNPKELQVDKSTKKETQPLVLSEAQAEFKLDAVQSVTFRWVAAPKSEVAVSYRLRVWQLMQGQNAATAMKENQPIVTREVAGTEVTVSDIYTGPCRPPYLCDFVWSADVVSKEGTGTPSASGSLEVGTDTGATTR
jgi:hypothetical protein